MASLGSIPDFVVQYTIKEGYKGAAHIALWLYADIVHRYISGDILTREQGMRVGVIIVTPSLIFEHKNTHSHTPTHTHTHLHT